MLRDRTDINAPEILAQEARQISQPLKTDEFQKPRGHCTLNHKS